MILMMKKLSEYFMKKNYKKQSNREKVIKKGSKLYVKWKGYDNSLNSWIDKKTSLNEIPFHKNESILS